METPRTQRFGRSAFRRQAAALLAVAALLSPGLLGLAAALPQPLALSGVHLRLAPDAIAVGSPYVEAGDNVSVDITVTNDGDAPSSGTLALFLGDPLVVSPFARPAYSVGPNTTFVATAWLDTTDLVGIQVLVARIETSAPPDAGTPDDNEARTTVRVHHSVVDQLWQGTNSFLVNESYPHTGFITVRGNATLTVGPAGVLDLIQRRDGEFDLLVEENGTLRITGGNVSSAFALGVELRDSARLIVEAGGLLAASVRSSGAATVRVDGGRLEADTFSLQGGTLLLNASVLSARAVQAAGASLTVAASTLTAEAPIEIIDAPSAAFTGSLVAVASTWVGAGEADAVYPGVAAAISVGSGPFQSAVRLSGTSVGTFHGTTLSSLLTIAGAPVVSTVPIEAVGGAAGTFFRTARVLATDPTGAPVLNATVEVRHRSNSSVAALVNAPDGLADIELASTFFESGAAFMLGQYKAKATLGATSSPEVPFNFALFPDLSPGSLVLEVPAPLPLYEPWPVAPPDPTPRLITADTLWDADASVAHNIEVTAALTLSGMNLSLDQSHAFERYIVVTGGGRLDLEGARIQSNFPFNLYVLNGTDASITGESAVLGNVILHAAGNLTLGSSRLTGSTIGDGAAFACDASYLWSPKVDLRFGSIDASDCVLASPAQVSLQATGPASLENFGVGTTFEPFDASREPSLSFARFDAASAEIDTSATGSPAVALDVAQLNATGLTAWTRLPFEARFGGGPSSADRLRVVAPAFDASLAGTTLTLERGAVEGGAPTAFTGAGAVALRAFLTVPPTADPSVEVSIYEPVSVHVVDGVGLPVPGATVRAVAASGAAPSEFASTDVAGNTELLLLVAKLSVGTTSAGPTYRINATREQTASATVAWDSTQASALEFTLARSFGEISGEATVVLVSPLANGLWRVVASTIGASSIPAFLAPFREAIPALDFSSPVYPGANVTAFVAADFVFTQGPERASLPMAGETATVSFAAVSVATLTLDADGIGETTFRAPLTSGRAEASLSVASAALPSALGYDVSFDLTAFPQLHLEGGITKPNATFKPSETITVTGVVRDDAGRPVQGAAVTMIYGTGSFSRTVTTPPDGSFAFKILAPTDLGSYEIRISASARDTLPAPDARFPYQVSNSVAGPLPARTTTNINLVGLSMAIGIAAVGATVFLYAYVQRRVGKGEFVVCGNCDKPTLASSRKCRNCGVEFEANLAKCSKCSSWISPDSSECPQCHTKFSRERVREERDLGPEIPPLSTGVRDGFDIPESVPLTARRAEAGRLEDLEFRLPGTTDTLDLGEKGTAPSFSPSPFDAPRAAAKARAVAAAAAADAPLERTELPRVDETDSAVRDVSPMEGGAPTTKEPVSLGNANVDLSRTTAAATATKPDAHASDEFSDDALRELLLKAAPELSRDVLPPEIKKELQDIARGEAPVASEKRVAASVATAGTPERPAPKAPALPASERAAEAPEKSRRTAFDVFSKPTKQVPAGYEKKGGGEKAAQKEAAAKGAPVCPNCGGNWVVQRDGKNSCRVCGTRW